jgi:hypothetical protein
LAKIIGQGSGYNCANHPSKEGVGVCKSCGKVICEDCTIRVGGVITCTNCFRRTAKKPASYFYRFLANPIISLFYTLLSFILIAWFCYYVAAILLDIDDLFRNVDL